MPEAKGALVQLVDTGLLKGLMVEGVTQRGWNLLGVSINLPLEMELNRGNSFKYDPFLSLKIFIVMYM